MNPEQIISLLPYQNPFLFVDGINQISEDGIKGHYTFKPDEFFYEGHFKNNPITPGVILTECMAQIGLVCLGIYLIKDELNSENQPQIALTSNQVDFYLTVLPGEKVTVTSEKEVFRFNKLKCKVKMLNEKGELIARGLISGMMKA
ncbi:3-hydroxyacyl-[acyl-carrier-protein] dehydratase [Winogradskyella wandonensis]|uniref:3-hydroxyacyl-[acyl-carrier-protein] dehydratase n=1 Tax=Winogradskyella wandonensis TaxID=1442586 RepID=A0A4R1KS84_9FLAO|nr:FabA/FabZ family ACP-dehydratase [Winogradskyella wandonensis]TCK67892.1 3-hydroxyacyl-[acyl-carrier-protein] dehydratase [Winogradskyella wandonensis]